MTPPALLAEARMAAEWRFNKWGPMRKLADAEGHAMVRYKGAAVHVIPLVEWLALPVCDRSGKLLAPPRPTEGEVG